MAMLKLPTEIFEKIIGELAKAESSDLAASCLIGHRLVCRTFNNFITEKICAETGKVKHGLAPFSNAEIEYRMRVFGTLILHWKVVHGGYANRFLWNSVRQAVGQLMGSKGKLTRDAYSELYSKYARNTCDALKGLGFERFKTLTWDRDGRHQIGPPSMLLLARAAIGDTTMLGSEPYLRPRQIFHASTSKPSIFEAAVAANQIEAVKEMLEYVNPFLRGKQEDLANRFEIQPAALAIVNALRLAIRMSRDDIGFELIKFLGKRVTVCNSIERDLIERIFEDCVSYGNSSLFATVMWWKRYHELPKSTGSSLKIKLYKWEFKFVLRRGLPTLVRHIIRTEMIDLNAVKCNVSVYYDDENPETALWLALSLRKYKMAKVILDEGADIDHVLPETNRSAYWQAVSEEKGDDQYYLIKWGADFRPHKYHGTPWSDDDKARMLANCEIHLRNGFSKDLDIYQVGYRRKRN